MVVIQIENIQLNFNFNKKIDGNKTFIFGVASTTNIDRSAEFVNMKSLKLAFDRFLEINPVLLYNHDINRVVGKILPSHKDFKSEVIENELRVVAVLSETAGDIDTQVREGFLKSFSIGGKGTKSPSGELTITDLYEISIVPIGDNKDAVFNIVKTIKGDEFMVNELEMDMIVQKAVETVQKAQKVDSADDIVKGLQETVVALTEELDTIKAKTVKKGIVETEPVVDVKKGVVSNIMSKFYMED